MKNTILLLIPLFVVAACGAELTIQGSQVRLGTESELKQCQILGSTRFSLSATRVKLMQEEDMKDRLAVEARNFAARIGGNMVLPVGAIEEGKQSFKIYNCPVSKD